MFKSTEKRPKKELTSATVSNDLKDIAEQICNWGKQKTNSAARERIEVGTIIDTSLKVKDRPRRLYSLIETAIQDRVKRTSVVNHSFPIQDFYVREKRTTESSSNSIYIIAVPLILTRSDVDGKRYTAELKQEATFNINTGEISIKLKEDASDFLYISNYKIDNMFTDSAKIVLDPYTQEPTKIIKNIQRTTTILSPLNGPQINIYSYLNHHKLLTGFDEVTTRSTLEQMKIKFNGLKSEFNKLKSQTVKSEDIKKEIKKYDFVDSVLKSDLTLTQYNNQLLSWFRNYNKWNTKGGNAPKAEEHQYIFEYKKIGKPRLSNYMIQLINRTHEYDSRIVSTKDTETVIDYTLLDKAKLQDREAKVPIKDQLKVVIDIEHVDETFGIYAPYLVSDILRYVSTFLNLNAIDSLCLTSENIEEFCKYINGFKSLVFNVVSLYHQLVLHKQTSSCDKDIIMKLSYSSSLYSNLSWLKNKQPTPIPTPGKQTESLLKASGKKTSALSPTETSALSVATTSVTETSASSASFSEYRIEPSIEHWIMFNPCPRSTIDYLNILAKEPPDQSKIVQFKLLDVSEPILGDTEFDTMKDFDLLYAESFKPLEIAGLLSSFFGKTTLRSNFIDFIGKRYNYFEDLDTSKLIQETNGDELNDVELFPYLSINEDPTTSSSIASGALSEASASSASSFWSGFKFNTATSETPKPIKKPNPVLKPSSSIPESKPKVRERDLDENFDFEPVVLTKEKKTYPVDYTKDQFERADMPFTRAEKPAKIVNREEYNDRGKESQSQYNKRKGEEAEEKILKNLGYTSKEDQLEKHTNAKIDGLTRRVMIAAKANKQYNATIRSSLFDDEKIKDIITSLYTNNLAQFNRLNFNNLLELIFKNTRAIPRDKFTDGPENKGEVYQMMQADLKEWRTSYEAAAAAAAAERAGLEKSRQKSRGSKSSDSKSSGSKGKKDKGGKKQKDSEYREKYLKYKTKYLELKSKLNL